MENILSTLSELHAMLKAHRENLRQLWTHIDTGDEESEAGTHTPILVTNVGIMPSPSNGNNFRPYFRQKFDPSTGTIAAFLVVYEAAMRHASDKQKFDYILNCLSPEAQEVVIPELDSVSTWPAMKALLISKFGDKLSLDVKKEAFTHIAFKPKETLKEFSSWFYLEGQQLMTSGHITIEEAYNACANALKPNEILCFHFKGHFQQLVGMKEIKVLLLDMYLTHTGPVLHSAPAATVAKPAGTTQLPILITDSKRTSCPGQVGCHNCGQPGHHSKNCTNA